MSGEPAAEPLEDAVARAAAAHRDRWGEPDFVVRAPGRVNLIGEHTDYNDGFVLPMAIGADTAIAVSAAPRMAGGAGTESSMSARRASDIADRAGSASPANASSDLTRSNAEEPAGVIWSEGFGTVELGNPGEEAAVDHWAAHIRGVQALLSESGIAWPAWRGCIATDIPIGGGLSSSAALEVAIALALLRLAGQEWSPTEIARLGQRVENDVLGLPSGIMDQLISAGAVDGHASLIDCRSLEARPVALGPEVRVAILDTQTRRELTGTAFAERRESCARAAALLGVGTLRDATLCDLDLLDPAAHAVEHRRARHVITENRRTLDAAEALAQGDIARFGELMSDSHRSLRDDYEVSGPALDRAVEAAMVSPGCLGARMTGGGFAGCAVALVEAGQADAFEQTAKTHYAPEALPPGNDTGALSGDAGWPPDEQPGLVVRFSRPSSGASVLEPGPAGSLRHY